MIRQGLRFWVLLLALSTLPLCAQKALNFPWWNSPVRADIGLTPQQKQRIQRIVHSYRNRLLDARNNVRKAEGDLQDLMNDADVNMAAARPVIERLAQARANSSRVFTEMSVQLRSVLTLEQWRKLVRRWDANQGRRRPLDTQVPP